MGLKNTIGRTAGRLSSQVRASASPGPWNRDSKGTVFVGHTRFSVHQFGNGSFQASRTGDRGIGFSEKEYTSWLYGEKRLNPRMDIFLNESVPQLARAAGQHRVVHIVSHSPSLPATYKKQLRDAATRYPFIRINETTQTVNPMPPRNVVLEELKKFGMTSGPFGVYRLDDDDVLSDDYFDRMAKYVDSEYMGWWVSLGRGYSAVRVNGEYIFARELYYPKIALGLMVVASLSADGSIEHLNAPKHTMVDRYAPTIIDSREPAILHIRHETQDSTVKGSEEPFFQNAFDRIHGEGPANLAELGKLFPNLAKNVHAHPGLKSQEVTLLSEPTVLPRAGLSYEWNNSGPLSLLIDVRNEERLGEKRVEVEFTVESDSATTTRTDQEVTEFFAIAGAQYSPEKGKYSMYMPEVSTGIGCVLCIEPPEGIRVTSFSINPVHPEDVQLAYCAAYPLTRSA